MDQHILQRNWIIKRLITDPLFIAQHNYYNELCYLRFRVRTGMNTYLIRLIERAQKEFPNFLEKDNEKLLIGMYWIGSNEIREMQHFYYAEMVIENPDQNIEEDL